MKFQFLYPCCTSEIKKVQTNLVLSGKTDYLSASIIINTDIFPVIIDTTSNYLIVAKKKCEGCSQYPPLYKESPVAETIPCDSQLCHSTGNVCEKPTKYDPTSCGYVTTLSNGAHLRTFLVKDLISIDDFKNIPVPIATIYEQTNGNNLTNAIFGVGPSCATCPPSPLKLILDTLKKPYITYFGGISLGSVDPLLYSVSINYTVMNKNDSLYAFEPNLIGSYWNGEQLKLNRSDYQRIVINSGSSLSFLPSDAFSKFKLFLKNACKNDFSLCSQIEKIFTDCLIISQIDKFPSLELYFDEDFVLSIPAKTYFYSVSKDDKIYHCIGIQEGKTPYAVLGVNLMRELYIVFDNVKEKIGFGKKTSKEPIASIDLAQYTKIYKGKGKKKQFLLVNENDSKQRVFHLIADSIEEMEHWIKEITTFFEGDILDLKAHLSSVAKQKQQQQQNTDGSGSEDNKSDFDINNSVNNNSKVGELDLDQIQLIFKGERLSFLITNSASEESLKESLNVKNSNLEESSSSKDLNNSKSSEGDDDDDDDDDDTSGE
eukprot:gene7524-9247_t